MVVGDDLHDRAHDSTRFLVNPLVGPRRVQRVYFVGKMIVISQEQILKQRDGQVLIDVHVACVKTIIVIAVVRKTFENIRVLPAVNWTSDLPKGPFLNSEFGFNGQYVWPSNTCDLSLPFSNVRRPSAVFLSDPYT